MRLCKFVQFMLILVKNILWLFSLNWNLQSFLEYFSLKFYTFLDFELDNLLISMNNNHYRSLKCPYCPIEQSINDAKQIYFWLDNLNNRLAIMFWKLRKKINCLFEISRSSNDLESLILNWLMFNNLKS